MDDRPDPIMVAGKMLKLIDLLRDEGHRAEDLIRAKAEAIRDYDMAIGVATTKLKDGGTQATLIPAKAKADCADKRLDLVLAEELLKAHYSRVGILQAQLNGFQSINRHLSVV